MAKEKATKSKKKGKRKVNPEWDDNSAIPDRPDRTIDLYTLGKHPGKQTLEAAIQEWEKKHQKCRPKTRNSHEPYRYHADILRFAESMDRSPLSYREHMLLTDQRGQIFLLNAKRLFCVGGISNTGGNVTVRSIDKDETPLGILLVSCDVRKKGNSNFYSLILINGDEGAAELFDIDGVDKCDFPTTSFECLHQFYGKEPMRTVIKRLTDNVLRVLDYSPDERRPLSKRHKTSLKITSKGGSKKYNEKMAGLKPPEFGFTLIGIRGHEEWHRSGYVLFEDTKQVGAISGTGMMHLLLGQDENTYFGCELSEACSSIDEALRSLVPEELQGRNDLVRQGEWFMVPVDKSEVPAEKDTVLLFDGDWSEVGWSGGEVFLPLDDPDSNRHFVHGNGRVSRDGKVYVQNCTLGHEEHLDVDGGSGWVTFRKNTAVRSFSQEGVD